MKAPLKSKTVWAGAATLVFSIFTFVVEFWSLLSPEQIALLQSYFGPELVAFIGALMIGLRIYTVSPLGFSEGEVGDK